GATTGNVGVTVGGAASNGVNFVVLSQPNISSVTPAYIGARGVVVISGSKFGASQGLSTVSFNGILASPAASWVDNTIVVQVPSTASSGNVVVTVGGQASNGFPITVAANTPAVTGFWPTSDAVGTPVTIAGYNFGSTQGSGYVSFNGTQATATWGNTSIATSVPNGATSGPVTVNLNNGGGSSNGVCFGVDTSTPCINAISPASGVIVTTVTIAGLNFGATQGPVTLNGVTCPVVSWSSSSIQFTVQTGATTGNVYVTIGSARYAGVFTVLAPIVTNLNPDSGRAG